jgi:hypothetical protein
MMGIIASGMVVAGSEGWKTKISAVWKLEMDHGHSGD